MGFKDTSERWILRSSSLKLSTIINNNVNINFLREQLDFYSFAYHTKLSSPNTVRS